MSHATAHRLHRRFSESGLRVEVLLVDDGSRAEQRPDPVQLPASAHVIQLERNRGKGYAVREGLLASKGDCRVFTDVDLPYGAESLLNCHAAVVAGGADLVYGDRSLPQSRGVAGTPAIRRLSSVAFRVAVWTITGLRHADTQCGVKGLRGDVAEAIVPLLRTDGFAFDVEIFRCALDNHLTCRPIPVQLANGEHSTVRLVRDSAAMFRDLLAIHSRAVRGAYRVEKLDDRMARDPAELPANSLAR